MGDQQTLFLCIVASGGFAAVLGGAFGALVGAVTWLNGRAAGTAIGFRMARAYETAAGYKLTVGQKGALVGGADGSIFLAVLGMLVGALVGWRMPAAWEVLLPLAVGLTLIVGAGAVFGLLAYLLLRVGVRALGVVFLGAMAGAVIGLLLGDGNGLFYGIILGFFGATIVALIWWRRGS
jgi:hypothetical protein